MDILEVKFSQIHNRFIISSKTGYYGYNVLYILKTSDIVTVLWIGDSNLQLYLQYRDVLHHTH